METAPVTFPTRFSMSFHFRISTHKVIYVWLSKVFLVETCSLLPVGCLCFQTFCKPFLSCCAGSSTS